MRITSILIEGFQWGSDSVTCIWWDYRAGRQIRKPWEWRRLDVSCTLMGGKVSLCHPGELGIELTGSGHLMWWVWEADLTFCTWPLVGRSRTEVEKLEVIDQITTVWADCFRDWSGFQLVAIEDVVRVLSSYIVWPQSIWLSNLLCLFNIFEWTVGYFITAIVRSCFFHLNNEILIFLLP